MTIIKKHFHFLIPYALKALVLKLDSTQIKSSNCRDFFQKNKSMGCIHLSFIKIRNHKIVPLIIRDTLEGSYEYVNDKMSIKSFYRTFGTKSEDTLL